MNESKGKIDLIIYFKEGYFLFLSCIKIATLVLRIRHGRMSCGKVSKVFLISGNVG